MSRSLVAHEIKGCHKCLLIKLKKFSVQTVLYIFGYNKGMNLCM